MLLPQNSANRAVGPPVLHMWSRLQSMFKGKQYLSL